MIYPYEIDALYQTYVENIYRSLNIAQRYVFEAEKLAGLSFLQFTRHYFRDSFRLSNL